MFIQHDSCIIYKEYKFVLLSYLFLKMKQRTMAMFTINEMRKRISNATPAPFNDLPVNISKVITYHNITIQKIEMLKRAKCLTCKSYRNVTF